MSTNFKIKSSIKKIKQRCYVTIRILSLRIKPLFFHKTKTSQVWLFHRRKVDHPWRVITLRISKRIELSLIKNKMLDSLVIKNNNRLESFPKIRRVWCALKTSTKEFIQRKFRLILLKAQLNQYKVCMNLILPAIAF